MGDCVGADFQFFQLIKRICPLAQTIGHIPDKANKRAFCRYDIEHPPKPYLERNHDIVDESELLIATPKEKTEVLRSGTWATVRYAQKTKKPIIIIHFDGELQLIK